MLKTVVLLSIYVEIVILSLLSIHLFNKKNFTYYISEYIIL